MAWIRNTVDDAIDAHAKVQEQVPGTLLFHARFAPCDRALIEQEVLRRFGPRSPARAGLVVATQVIEQSLDLDFDLIVTDLAPIDLMIQRAGRVWRHGVHPRALPSPELLVLAPDPVDDPPADWLRELPGTEAVYRDPALLWRSAREIFSAGIIESPNGMRRLIEPVYATDAPVPARLERKSNRAQAEAVAAGHLGCLNVLQPADGYCRKSDAWTDEVRIPTRLDDDMIQLRLARKERGRIRPWADDVGSARAWASSELSIRRSRLGELATDTALASMEEARRDWPSYQREIPVLVLEPAIQGWWEARGARYHPPLD